MKIKVNNSIRLEMFSKEHVRAFYNAIFEIKDTSDDYRLKLQKKYTCLELVKDRIYDAIEGKYEIDGSPDFFIFYKNKIAGIFEFHPFNEGKDEVEVGYWLFKEYRNKQIMTNVMLAMIEWAKINIKKSTLTACTGEDNMASRNLLAKCGLKETGSIIDDEIEYEIGLK